MFILISLILLVVLLVSFVMRFLAQPMIIGYILAGILVGPIFFNIMPEGELFITFSEMGIAFLLFIVGLHLSPKVIQEVGKVSLVTGVGQVVFTSAIGYVLSILLGFDSVTSIYIALGLSFSSTIIIMKLLSDKDSLEKLYGKISIGFLLVQDLIAITILLVVSSFSGGGTIEQMITSTVLKGVILFAVLVPIAVYVLPRFANSFSRNQEFLFVFAISWGLGLASLFKYAGFSLEVGALIAGVILSIAPYSYEISSRLRPLRDFFIIMFFILLGSQMVFNDIATLFWPALLMSLFILIGNPLIVIFLMGRLGYSRHTGFMAGLSVAQISEFSLILISLAVKIGHIDSSITTLLTIVALVTIAGSTYMIQYSEKIFPYVAPWIKVFEKKNMKEKKARVKKFQYFLLGENRIGFSIMKAFKKLKREYVVIDYNPDIIKRLEREGVSTMYGDVSNVDFIEDLDLKQAKLIVSTIPDADTNFMILRMVRHVNNKATVILAAKDIEDALAFYAQGADYVILSHFLGGDYTANIIEKAGERRGNYKKYRFDHVEDLYDRLERGHEHPDYDKDKRYHKG